MSKIDLMVSWCWCYCNIVRTKFASVMLHVQLLLKSRFETTSVVQDAWAA